MCEDMNEDEGDYHGALGKVCVLWRTRGHGADTRHTESMWMGRGLGVWSVWSRRGNTWTGRDVRQDGLQGRQRFVSGGWTVLHVLSCGMRQRVNIKSGPHRVPSRPSSSLSVPRVLQHASTTPIPPTGHPYPGCSAAAASAFLLRLRLPIPQPHQRGAVDRSHVSACPASQSSTSPPLPILHTSLPPYKVHIFHR